MKKLYWTLVAPLAAGLALAANPAASAQPKSVDCIGTLAPGIYVNVTVPRNQHCTIPGVPEGVNITGNVSVAAGATLITNNRANIDGNILATEGGFLNINNATVGGNIILNGTIGGILVQAMRIGGHLQISNATGGIALAVISNTVTGNVVVLTNSTNGPHIGDNTIGGNLVCAGNTPPPDNIISGMTSPNNVAGNKSGQCAQL